MSITFYIQTEKLAAFLIYDGHLLPYVRAEVIDKLILVQT
jgi:hypothetical protein